MRWLHVLSGVLWIGLLWYFNFVQIPTMPKIPDELKPAVGKHIAPNALFWFRWAAMATLATGLVLGAAVAEDVALVAAVRAEKGRHVLDDMPSRGVPRDGMPHHPGHRAGFDIARRARRAGANSRAG